MLTYQQAVGVRSGKTMVGAACGPGEHGPGVHGLGATRPQRQCKVRRDYCAECRAFERSALRKIARGFSAFRPRRWSRRDGPNDRQHAVGSRRFRA